MALYYHSSKESMARNIPGMIHVPLNSPHIKKEPFPPKWAGPCSLTPKPERHAARHVYVFPIKRRHTTNFQKGKIAQKRPLFDLRIEKATKIEIEIIDSDDKDVSGSDHAPLRQTHIRVSPLDTISQHIILSRVRLQCCGSLKRFRFTCELPRRPCMLLKKKERRDPNCAIVPVSIQCKCTS
jgi:hypothetical protein